MTDDGRVTLDDEGLLGIQVNGRAALWIPGGPKQLLVMLVFAHVGEAGHLGAVANPPAAVGILWLVSHGGARHRVR